MFVSAREVGSFIRVVAEIQRALDANVVVRVELGHIAQDAHADLEDARVGQQGGERRAKSLR
jgi:hypothetical protein